MVPLITSNYFKGLTPVQKQDICNGTGSAGTPKGIVKILDSFDGLGLNVRPASDRHDCGYNFASTWIQKIKADCVFFLNICILAINAFLVLPLSTSLGNLIFFPIRLFRATLYFAAVFFFGWFAWKPYKGEKG